MSDAAPTIRTEHAIMFFDTDCAGVVHNLAYLRFIEIARTHFAEQLGMRLAEMQSGGLVPVVVSIEVQYKKPAKLGDTLVVEGRLARFDRLRFWMEFDVKRAADGAMLVQSQQMLCVIQMPAAKPVRLPAEWAERWPGLVGK